jgi:type II secretory pathway component PulK
METLSELHRVKGFDDETYEKVAPYLTVYPVSGDAGQINVNTAPLALIQALDERIDEALARRAIDNRPWDNPQKMKDLLGATYNDVLPYLTVRSQVFSIQAEGKVNDTIKRISAVVQRAGTNLPFLYYRVE